MYFNCMRMPERTTLINGIDRDGSTWTSVNLNLTNSLLPPSVFLVFDRFPPGYLQFYNIRRE